MTTTQQRVTIPDVARETGYSMMAVSYALADKPGVSEDTRELIKRTAEKMGYAPDLGARAVRNGDSGIVALLVGNRLPNLNPWLTALTKSRYIPCLIRKDRDSALKILSIRARVVLSFTDTSKMKIQSPVVTIARGMTVEQAMSQLNSKL